MNPLRICLAVVALAFSACAYVTPIPKPQTTWAQASGQIQVSGTATPIVGEIAIRYDDQNFLAEVSKGPSLPLLKLHAKGAHGEEITMKGALARGAWKGSAAEAPANLKVWAALPEVFHWAQAHSRGEPFEITLRDIKSGARRKGEAVTYLEFTRDGERIVCRLHP